MSSGVQDFFNPPNLEFGPLKVISRIRDPWISGMLVPSITTCCRAVLPPVFDLLARR